jgi:hypothetical protein
MTVRTKFRVVGVVPFEGFYQNGPAQGKHVTLNPVYQGGTNASWAEATPCGQISLTINNPEAAALFVEGVDLFVDFSYAIK